MLRLKQDISHVFFLIWAMAVFLMLAEFLKFAIISALCLHSCMFHESSPPRVTNTNSIRFCTRFPFSLTRQGIESLKFCCFSKKPSFNPCLSPTDHVCDHGFHKWVPHEQDKLKKDAWYSTRAEMCFSVLCCSYIFLALASLWFQSRLRLPRVSKLK